MKTWQRISRSIDKIDGIIDNIKYDLGVKSSSTTRNILLGDEVTEWRAVIRMASFLSSKRSETPYNIYKKALGSDLISFSENVKEKRYLYFSEALDTPLENITYPNLRVVANEEIGNLLYEADSDSEEETETE